MKNSVFIGFILAAVIASSNIYSSQNNPSFANGVRVEIKGIEGTIFFNYVFKTGTAPGILKKGGITQEGFFQKCPETGCIIQSVILLKSVNSTFKRKLPKIKRVCTAQAVKHGDQVYIVKIGKDVKLQVKNPKTGKSETCSN